MRRNSKEMTTKERKLFVAKIVADCEAIASEHIKNWKPVNAKWPTVDGCAYLRLSDEDQVAIEKGSLEQQINIAISEAIIGMRPFDCREILPNQAGMTGSVFV